MSIREMKESDLPQVLAIQSALAFQEWNERQFLAEIHASYALCVVYEDAAQFNGDPRLRGDDSVHNRGDDILGYAIFHLMGPDSELLSIATSPEQQRSGIGSALLNEGLSKLDFASGDRMFLEVREGNEKARRFYEKHGFEAYAKRDKYYSDGENAVLYRKA